MKLFYFLLIALLLTHCSAPRSITSSGKVTPKGHFTAGGNLSYNLPTATANELFGSLESGVKTLVNQDSIVFDSTFNPQIKALTIYSLDPIGMATSAYLRYGIMEKFDVGFTWAGGVKVYDIFYQFAGSTQTQKNPSSDRFFGSVGLQYSSQEYELPSFLGKFQKVLQYKLERQDLLIPLIFSNSFGKEEKYGAIGYGIVFGRSWIHYDYEPNLIYELVSDRLEPINDVPQGNNAYNTYGVFSNLKFGYKFIYANIGLSLYYQDYGRYNLYKDKTAEFSGMTVVPNFGLQFLF